MKEYIERASLMGALTSGTEQLAMREMTGAEAYAEFVRLVNFAPAANVVEVRHGRWAPEIHHTYLPVEYDDAGGPILHEYISYRCSLCGREEAKEELYCHCGARMDKEDEHEAD